VLLVVASEGDTPALIEAQRGGVSYGATVVEQQDGTTMRIDLGPRKGAEPRGLVLVHAMRGTRFNMAAGVHMSVLVGSLGSLRLGAGMRVTVVVDPRSRSDGSYTLLELTTNTR
jgi:hypothetical protein